MERETHHDSDEHIIDILSDDDDSSSYMSLDEGSYSSARSSLSTDEETLNEGSTSGCEYSLWNSMELVITLVQIVAALVVLTLAKDEHPHALLLAWLIGYTCGCITRTLLSLSWRLRKYNQVWEYSRTRMDGVMEHLKVGLECFFVVWLTLGIVWICDGRSSSSDAPKLYRLCVAFIAFSCIRFAAAVLLWAGICFFLPCIVDESLEHFFSSVVDKLRSNDADSVGEGLGGGSMVLVPSHDDCCCICLEKYGEKEGEIRKLECSHIFHSKCIENWLRIKPTCPLCQSHVRGR